MSETHASSGDHYMPGLYEIRIKGHLDDRWADWFGGLTVAWEDNGETLLTGPVTDQAALHGLLRRVRDLGLPLLSVSRVRPDQAITSDEGRLMKAVVYTKYGPPDVLESREVEKPIPGDNEVLIRVRAASVNPHDFHSMRGLPYLLRLATGLRRPKHTRLGLDLAGQVEAVGRNVTQFQPGDEVFGARRGALAEYVCASENALVLKPANLTFEQAAAVPVAAWSALQGLRDKGRIQPGQKVLINGAAGGVGTFAVQIAKVFGAEVTAVCSTRNVDMLRSLGADQVIDYTQENFTRSGQRYDLLFDTVGNHSLSACRRVMSPTGTYVTIAGSPGHLFKLVVLSRFVSQSLIFFISATSNKDLVFLKELIEANKVIPVIDRRYTFSEVPEAIRYLGEGHARGKVAITLE